MTNRNVRRIREEALDASERQAAVAAEQAAAAQSEGPPGKIALKNGIVFSQKAVPPLLIRRAARNVHRPEVPVVWIEDKGREEENPNDPSYMAAMETYFETTGLAALDAVIMVGLVLEHVPDGVPGPDSQEWLDDMEALGLPTEFKSAKGRFLEWVKSVALADMSDYLLLQSLVTRQMGVSEADVATAIDSFRGVEGRGADLGASPTPQSGNGHRVPASDGGDSP